MIPDNGEMEHILDVSPGRSTQCLAHIKIIGMTCASCVQTIKSELLSHPPVIRCEIALLAQRAEIEYDSDTPDSDNELLTAEKIVEIIDSMGFEASIIPEQGVNSVELKIIATPKSQSRDAAECALLELPGVYGVKIDLTAHHGIIEYDNNQLGIRDLIETIESFGYSTAIDDELIANSQRESLNRTREIADWTRVVKDASRCAIPVAIITMVIPRFGGQILKDFFNLDVFKGVPLSNIVLLIFCIEMHLTAGRGFYKRALASFAHKTYTMDTLIVLGASSSLIFSILSMFISLLITRTEGKVFFETSVMLIAFVSLGKYLECLSKKRTSKKLTDLMVLFPSNATLITPLSKKHPFPIPENILKKLPKGIAKKFKFDPTYQQSGQPQFPFHLYEERVIQTKYVQKGDLLKVSQGERIPTDSIVVYGSTTMDESAVTGESFPVEKFVGDSVIGGAINGPGFVVLLAVHVGRETTVAQMIKLVSDAQISRTSVQSLADSISAIFIPTVISLGIITFASWMIIGYGLDWTPRDFSDSMSHLYVALNMAISVIVVACPCALGLATPTAMMVGTGVAAKHGIIIKGAPPLEKVGKITKIVFDKTGTLTTGKIVVVGKHHIPSKQHTNDSVSDPTPFFMSEVGVWNSIVAAENVSEHIIGSTIVEHLKEYRTIPVNGKQLCCTISHYEAVIGFGMKCHIHPPVELLQNNANPEYFVNFIAGNRAFLLSNGCELKCFLEDQRGETLENIEKFYEAKGCTVTYIAIDGQLRALFSISDTPKPEAAVTVQYLKDRGISVCMITGDQESAAKLIAREVGIDEIYYGSTPTGKQNLINRFKEEGHVVAMVGDGINDSASLASADLGIAVNTASGMSMEASDMVLVRQDLTGVIVAISLSVKILRRIKINFAWAFIYNLLMIPLAAGLGAPFNITLHAMAAAFAMSLSSVSVVLSSLCLNFYTPPKIYSPYLPVNPNSPSSVYILPECAQQQGNWSQYFGDTIINRKSSRDTNVEKSFRHFLRKCKLNLYLCLKALRSYTHIYNKQQSIVSNGQKSFSNKMNDILFYYSPVSIPTFNHNVTTV